MAVFYQLTKLYSRTAYFFIVSVLLMLSVLILLDEFGLADLFVLALHTAALWLLIQDRTRYLGGIKINSS